MKHLLKRFAATSILLFIFSICAHAQTNLALTAAATHSGGGGIPNYGPEICKDAIIPPFPTTTVGTFCWVNTNGWIEYTWPNPVTFDSVTFHNGYSTSRCFTSLILQYWDGAAYVNVTTLAGSPVADLGYQTPNPITTTKLRFFNIAGSNPAFAEIQVWEKNSTANDAGVANLAAPTLPFCAGNHNLSVRVKNFGINLINNVTLNWTLNGTAQTPIPITTPLDTMGGTGINTIDILLLANANLSNPTTLKAWTSNPNSVIDTTNHNDTLELLLQPSLNGTYTINSANPTAGTNYQSFTAFANALNTVGICGPVTANVVAGSGPYSETAEFANIQGTSAVNKIRINGNGETIQFNSTSTTNHRIVVLNGTKYMTINNLRIKSLNATYGWGVHITGDASRDSIINCEVDMSTITGTSSVNANGIVISGSNTSATTGTPASHLYIGDNKVIAGSTGSGGGYYGISFYGQGSTNQNDSIFIIGNEVSNFYYHGIYNYYSKNGAVNYNDVHRSTQTAIATIAYGINYYYGVGVECIGNKVHDMAVPGATSTSTFYGIYNYHYNNTAATPIKIANNIVYNLGNYSGSQYLMYNYGPGLKVYHNTVDLNLSQGTSTSTIYGMYNGFNNSSEVKNNIVNITGGNNGTKYGMYQATAAATVSYQKNNVYVNSSQTGAQNPYYWTTAHATLAAFQAAQPTQEIGSPNVDPSFIGSATGDLQPQAPVLMVGGENLTADVPVDIMGNTRSVMPTIGAFEFAVVGLNNARPLTFISPNGHFCAGLVPVEVSFGNVGTNNITSVQINWSVNGVTQTPFAYTGTLTPIGSSSGQSFDTVLLGNANLNTGGNNIVVWTSQPNGTADSHPANDTISTIATPATFAVSASVSTICANETSVVSLSPSTGYAPGAIAWEYSTNGTTWTTIPNSDTVNYLVTNISAPTSYRARILSSGANCTSPSTTVVVNYVAPPTVIGTESCGPGTFTLSATPASGTTLNWYNDQTTAVVFSNANTITTPPLTATKIYYVTSVASNGCQSVRTPVSATIHTLPPVNLGPNFDTCTTGAGATVTLNPGTQNPGAVFLWDDNSTGSTRNVSQSGTYSVMVTDTNTCSFADTITVNISPRPVIDLDANGTSFCIGATMVLDAGPGGENGGEYYWNTGAGTRTLSITSSGTYTVFVTSPAGCLAADTVTVIEDGYAPTSDGVHVLALSSDSFTFSAINPQNIANYEWDFGDGSPISISSSPTHKFSNNGQFLVKMKSFSSCADDYDSAYVNIIGLSVKNQGLDANLVHLYPNPNKTGVLNIELNHEMKVEHVTLFNVLGQQMDLQLPVLGTGKYFSINLPSYLVNGIYQIVIHTDKGIASRKIEIRR